MDTCNTIINALAKSGESDAANRAELLLAHMMELYKTGHNLDAKPNVRSFFNSVVIAWAKSDHLLAPKRAGNVLERMEELNQSRKWDISPDTTSFAMTINVYTRSNMFGKARSAYDLFLHMKELYDTSRKSTLQPNTKQCGVQLGTERVCLLRWWFWRTVPSNGDSQCHVVGLDESLYGKMDQETYGTYLKVINNQMPPSEAREKVGNIRYLHLKVINNQMPPSEAQKKVGGKLFRKCANDGMVGGMIFVKCGRWGWRRRMRVWWGNPSGENSIWAIFQVNGHVMWLRGRGRDSGNFTADVENKSNGIWTMCSLFYVVDWDIGYRNINGSTAHYDKQI